MVDRAPPSAGSPVHPGERAVHARLGIQGIESRARRIVRAHLPEPHRLFYQGLPYVVAAARDAQGRPWATLLTGKPGFVSSPSSAALRIAARPVSGDALEGALTSGTDLGLLGIILASRRRNRVNGRIEPDGEALAFTVDQSFGNCPQYIHERRWRWVDGDPGSPSRRASLDDAQQDGIRRADTFFIASGHPREGDDRRFGMDASHRGGEPGFVVVDDARRFVFPDYAGNDLFNTIGNLMIDPRVGVTFVDFETGSLLQITGRASIDWDSDAVAATPGARRLVIVDVDEVVELPRALPLRWDGASDRTELR